MSASLFLSVEVLSFWCLKVAASGSTRRDSHSSRFEEQRSRWLNLHSWWCTKWNNWAPIFIQRAGSFARSFAAAMSGFLASHLLHSFRSTFLLRMTTPLFAYFETSCFDFNYPARLRQLWLILATGALFELCWTVNGEVARQACH